MSKSKQRSTTDRSVAVVILGGKDEPRILMSCILPADGDNVRIVLHDSEHSASIRLRISEAEDFFEQALPLIDDEKQRPICGTLCADTKDGNAGGRLELQIANPETCKARLEMSDKGGLVQQDINRDALHRFFFAALEGICQDEDED